MNVTRRALAASVAALAAPALPRPALAQGSNWPRERPVTVIVPHAPGGGVDQMVRMIAPHVQQQVPDLRIVVENRPGAASQLGTEVAYNARPDGYTLCASVMPTLMSMPLERRVRYDAKRFVYIANVVEDPGGLWVNANSRFPTLAAMLEAAKASTGAVSVGTTGIGSDDHLLIAQLQQMAPGTEFNHVPFNGFAPVQTALIGGHIDVGCFNMTEGLPGLRDGRLRALGIGAAERIPVMKDVPTFKEQSFDLVAGSQRGIIAPPGLPDEIRDRLVAAFGAAMSSPGFRADAARVDLPVVPVLGEDFRKQVMSAEVYLDRLWEKAPWRND
ncbi:tripartite tricarboxylate transporter substrate binding protein [Pararoseomonas indoligenes]|uniref:Tripartite tricarboxylate transporter substrate binding protein n=1 Tax=Roseomonas indoligenes TaxID=2820811 RepID=A0A940N7G0_9PROT|nr:tripartite tricarboxylate transporter substrate binding protein [Pararoseomonas indoligenes]MBP0495487.1 tripartite tricarboxylate transporter substrate binding protein [Pararoseomonas indoligenes]